MKFNSVSLFDVCLQTNNKKEGFEEQSRTTLQYITLLVRSTETYTTNWWDKCGIWLVGHAVYILNSCWSFIGQLHVRSIGAVIYEELTDKQNHKKTTHTTVPTPKQ